MSAAESRSLRAKKGVADCGSLEETTKSVTYALSSFSPGTKERSRLRFTNGGLPGRRLPCTRCSRWPSRGHILNFAVCAAWFRTRRSDVFAALRLLGAMPLSAASSSAPLLAVVPPPAATALFGALNRLMSSPSPARWGRCSEVRSARLNQRSAVTSSHMQLCCRCPLRNAGEVGALDPPA